MKIVSVVGARPEFVQAVLLSKEIRRYHAEILVHTGQHYDDTMSNVFFQDLGLREPDYNLDVGSSSHAKQTGEILIRIERVLVQEKPDWVIVRGDTNSTLGAALAAVKLDIPIAHIEAGMRSFNRQLPEETNRVVTDHISNFLFCPTERAVKNLAREGISNGVYCVGDVMYDTLAYYSPLADAHSRILERLGLEPKSYLLATIHRAANTDVRSNLEGIFSALNRLSRQIVFPVHPRTRNALSSMRIEIGSNVRLIDPIGYLDMLVLEKNALKILTDSGGVQREAFFLGIPCLTLREETEWGETVDEGWNLLVGADPKKIIEAISHFDVPAGKPAGRFGDGKAGEKIVQILNQRGIP